MQAALCHIILTACKHITSTRSFRGFRQHCFIAEGGRLWITREASWSQITVRVKSSRPPGSVSSAAAQVADSHSSCKCISHWRSEGGEYPKLTLSVQPQRWGEKEQDCYCTSVRRQHHNMYTSFTQAACLHHKPGESAGWSKGDGE